MSLSAVEGIACGGEARSVLVGLSPDRVVSDQGNSYICDLPPELPVGDDPVFPARSQALLFENGVALGPAHARHHEIRTTGGGQFSHWHNQLYFSTSDNSSPRKNGRAYQLLVPAAMFAPEDVALTLGLGGLDLDKMAPLERYDLACRAFRELWRDIPLPAPTGRRIDADRAFAREFARLCQGATYTYERKYNLNELFKLTSHLPGDVVECGVYKGGSAFFLARHIAESARNKRLCLFDSFEGLSLPAAIDGHHWSAGDLSSTIEEVRAALAPLGPLPFVEFYRGWIPERFPEVADRCFCFVHIDLDLYQPTLDAISFFYPRMEAGGIILLDDYGFESCPGVTAAIDQYMSGKPEPVVNLASGGALIVRRL